jgi:hypothetical protein
VYFWAVPVQVAPFHVCPIAQRIHVMPVVLCVTVPSLLSIKSLVGVVGVAQAKPLKTKKHSNKKDPKGFKNLSGLWA